MKCNICGHHEFGDMNSRKNARCKKCGSLERTRLIWMYINKLNINENTKILHFAPERGLFNKLKSIAGSNYQSADLAPENYSFDPNCNKIDLTNLEDWKSNEFDLILHCHVLEHIPCNIAYTLFHIHRMLKPNGKHMFIIPFRHGSYDECFQSLTPDERVRRFGQSDHIRSFGRDDFDYHIGKILNISTEFNAQKDFSEASLLEANIPKSLWQGLNMGTVFSLNKTDYKLGNLNE